MLLIYFISTILLIVILPICLIYPKFRREMDAAQVRLQAGSQILQTQSGPIEYAETGQRYPVLISHGGAGGYDQGLVTAQTYLGGRFRGIAPSRFGHLRTPLAADSTAMAQADAYADLLDTLDIPHAAIVGTSGGGPSALQFALRHPARCSALIMTAAVSQFHPPRPLGVYKSDFLYWLITTYFQRFTLTKIGVTPALQATLQPAERELLSSLFATMNPISLRRAGLFHDVAEWADQAMWEANYPLAQINIPTLVIHAVYDTIVPFAHAQHVAEQIPDATLVKLKSGGHLRLGHSGAIQQEIGQFLDAACKADL